MYLDFKPTSGVRMKKGKKLINFEDNQQQKEEIQKPSVTPTVTKSRQRSQNWPEPNITWCWLYTQKMVTKNVEKAAHI